MRATRHNATEAYIVVKRQDQGIPDLKWMNRNLPIADVAKALDLHFGQGGMIHCWHPEKHQNGDRTPSVGIRKTTNRMKCFGCGSPPIGVADLVCDVQGVSVAEAALWIAGRFDVPHIPKHRHLESNPPRPCYEVGHEQPIELLVKSGIWASLSAPARAVSGTLYALAAKEGHDTFRLQISNRGIIRYSGLKSFSSVSKAIRQLEEIDWLQCLPGDARHGSVLRSASIYLLTPWSDGLMELANAMAVQNRDEIAGERELRKQRRGERMEAVSAATRCVAMKPTETTEARVITEYEPLYTKRSVVQNGATPIEAPNAIIARASEAVANLPMKGENL